VDRAVPIWGTPEDGNASDKTLNATRWSESAQLLAHYGVAPGVSIDIADAAMVTEANLNALGDTLFISRVPATYGACERVIDEAVAHHHGDEVGIMAQPKPTKHRPAASYKVSEGTVTWYGQSSRAVVVHSSSQEQRRQTRLARALKASYTGLEAVVDEASQQAYFCQADAAAAAAKRRAVPSASHQVEVVAEEHPPDGPGRPSTRKPRLVKALRYRLKATVRERPESIARHAEEAGCCVVLTNVPTAGEMAQSAAAILRAYKEQHGIEQNVAFLKDPLMVHSLFLKKPERIEALGLVWLLALLVWRLVERALRVHVETTGGTLTGWDKKATQQPTAFMMMTQVAAVLVVKVGTQRPFAQPLSTVQLTYLRALGVPTASFLSPCSG
jgi:transposase